MAVGYSIDSHFTEDESTDERFMFSDPFDRMAINCTTKYRAKKRRRDEDSVSDAAGPEAREAADTMTVTEERTQSDGMCDHLIEPESYAPDESDSDGELDNHLLLCNTMTLDSDLFEPDLEFDSEHSVDATNDDDDKATDTVSSAPLYQGSSLTLAASSGLIMKLR